MKKLIATVFLLFSMSAFSANEMAFSYNKLGGMIFFTFTECVYLNTGNRVPNNYYVYSTDTGGNKLVDGCYEYKYPFYFIEWNGGGRLSVNVNTVTPLKK